MKKIEAYEARWYTNADLGWSRGFYHVWYFHNQSDAEEASKEKWPFGSAGMVDSITLIIYDSIEEYKDEINRILREEALKKLSPEEKTALWL